MPIVRKAPLLSVFGLRIGLARDACEVVLDGGLSTGLCLRLADDPLLRLDIDHGKRVVGNPINLWGTAEHPEWGVEYTMRADGTLGPTSPSNLCVGVSAEAHDARLVLVERSDVGRRLVFGGGETSTPGRW